MRVCVCPLCVYRGLWHCGTVALQVGAAVAPDFLSGGRVRILRYSATLRRGTLRVGRLDSAVPPPTNTLPNVDVGSPEFVAFWRSRGFTIEEGIALMGSHALIDDQASRGCHPSLMTTARCGRSDRSGPVRRAGCLPRQSRKRPRYDTAVIIAG